MSNTFPKVSPDGRWIVFVQCRNGQLMRPDSQLYIVSAEGGVARRMQCNTPLMNSWHSFSPDGRWLVFSSKSRSPYTQMFLTHLDEDGNDSPTILIDNATAANRAVNLPEFVNIPPDGMMKIDVPAAESYRLFDIASDLTAKGQLDAGVAEWKKVLDLDPRNAKAHNNLGGTLVLEGNFAEGMTHLQEPLEIDPDYSEAQSNFGIAPLQVKKLDEALPHLQRSLELNPAYAKLYDSIISSLDWPASPPPQTALRLDDLGHTAADEEASQNASRTKRESLDAQYRRNLEAVLDYILACGGPARGTESEERSANQPNQREQPGTLRPPGASQGAAQSSDDSPEIEDLISRLEIPRLGKLAEQEDKNSDESFVAQRQILRIFLHTFEASSTLLAQNRNTQALACLEIAAQASAKNPYITYDLAKVQALNGQHAIALRTLQSAVEKGFNDADRTEGDRAFESLRGKPDFQKALAKMRDAQPHPAATL
jgi:Flp pilus assembly protein TadD